MGNKKLNLFEKIVITTAAGMVINKATGNILGKFIKLTTSNPGKIWNNNTDTTNKKQ